MIPLLGMEIDNNQLFSAGAVGTLGVFLFLMKFNAQLKSYIRDANNQKPEGREILGQPLKVSVDDKVMTEASHRAVCGSLHHRVGALETDVRMIRMKMDADKTEIISSGETRAASIHDRINVVLAAVSEVRGEIKHLTK